MTSDQLKALRTARAMVDLGHPLDLILASPVIPVELRQFVEEELRRDENFILTPARSLVADANRPDWVAGLDRSSWYYWPMLRQFLITRKHWESAALRSLDDSSDRVLRQLEPPATDHFDTRGLVLGFVQSGKTANYTAVIAKAADAGYRLVIVLSGIDKGLRRQTNSRLKRELVGYNDDRPTAVRMPPMGLQWHEFTLDELDGDFQPGYANHAALQGTQPVLLVVKKNGAVLRRLLTWLNDAPPEVRRTLPMLVIDDEADQASVDTRGTYQLHDATENPDYEAPSPINGLIRELLQKFGRRAYIAYTATPFANILIPHDTSDPSVGNDLYPKDFIIDLPKPLGYFGAEEFFGRMDAHTETEIGGLDVIREVPDADIALLQAGQLPESLKQGVVDFVLAGAARAQRGSPDAPATMLVHTSHGIAEQSHIRALLSAFFAEFRDEWRYQRNHGVRQRCADRWEIEFRPVTRQRHLERDVPFTAIEPMIGPFLEAIQVREINSDAGEVLDYEREPTLKAIAIGGNKLSRGLTLEGLLTSFFLRRTVMYDTLMQMGRWFGFRGGYEDLTRIYTTNELEGWFYDLANVEYQLREDIGVYEAQGLTPYQVGMRIWQHPTMEVTNRAKRRFASTTTIAQSYSQTLQQTFKFPFHKPQELAWQAENNLESARSLINTLGPALPNNVTDQGPIWLEVNVEVVLQFLREYQVDQDSRSISLPLLREYIERSRDNGELIEWTIGIMGRANRDSRLGDAQWAAASGVNVYQIARSRLRDTDSIGVLTSPGDESVGLDLELLERAQRLIEQSRTSGKEKSLSGAAREVRPATNGVLLIYPISRFSGNDLGREGNRRPLYVNPNDALARDIIGIALSFPRSNQTEQYQSYLEGTVRWTAQE